MKEGSLHHLTQLLNLLLAATNIAVCHVRLLLNLYGHLQAQAVVEKSKIHYKSLLSVCRLSALKQTVYNNEKNYGCWIEIREYLQDYPPTKTVRNPRNLPNAHVREVKSMGGLDDFLTSHAGLFAK